MRITDVAAALIRRGDRILICRRPPEKARGNLWEFPGGKREEGETLEQALMRECREELGIHLTVTGKFIEVLHEYPDISIRLTLLEGATQDEPQLREHTDLQWAAIEELDNYQFCPADTDIVAALKQEAKHSREPARESQEKESNTA